MLLTPKQQWAFRRSTARLNFLDGSVRSGKTVCFNHRFVKAIGEPKDGLPSDAIDLLIGKTLDSLRRNIINPLCDMLGNSASYYPGKRELHVFDNIIYTVGANDERSEGKIRGCTARKVLGDEITLWPESFFKMLDSRLSLDVSQFFGATNPDNPNHWLMTDYFSRAKQLDVFLGRFRLEDNTHLAQRYIDAIKMNYVGLWFKRFILGMWVAAEGAIYDFFNEDEHTLSRLPEATYYDVGIDYGTGNPTAFLLIGNNPQTKPKIWAEDEYYYDGKARQRQKTDKEYSTDLRMFLLERLGPKWFTKVRKIYLDPSAESFHVQLRQDGFHGIRHADNAVLDGIRTVGSMLMSGEYAIGTKCKHYIEEMYGYVWDSNAQKRGEDKPKKVKDHCQDGGRYVVHSKYGKRRVDLSKLTKR